MATYRALEAASTGVVRVLEDAFDPAAFPDLPVTFRLVGVDELARGLPAEIGVLAYAVEVSSGARHPNEWPDVTRGKDHPALPVDVHILVLVRAQEPGARLALTGWLMRTLADSPVLSASLLNRGRGEGPVFGEGERVAIHVDALPTADLLHRLGVLGGASADVLAVPYVLTGIDIAADRAGRS